jgi:hypothetical protein
VEQSNESGGWCKLLQGRTLSYADCSTDSCPKTESNADHIPRRSYVTQSLLISS